MLRKIDREEFIERAIHDLGIEEEEKKLEPINTKYMTPAERIAKARELMASGMSESEVANALGYGKVGSLRIAMAHLGKTKKQPLAEEQETKGIPALFETHTPVYTPPPMPEVRPAKAESPKLIPIVFDGERMTYRLGYQNQLVEFHENNLLVEGHKQYTPTSLRNLAAELLVVADMLESGKPKE